VEKETDSQFYLPFPPARLIKTKDFIKEVMEPAGNFSSKIKPNRFLAKFISELQDFSEDNFAETHVFEQADFYLPPKWRIVAEYLKGKKLIEGVFFEPFFNDEPKYYHLSIRAHSDPVLTDGNEIKLGSRAHGDSVDFEKAVASTIGEFIERYTQTVYREKDLIKASPKILKQKRLAHLDLNDLAGFSKEQKEKNPRLRFDEKTQFLWAEGKNLLTDQKILIPAQLVFWNYKLQHRNWCEPMLREQNTNGAGGHCTLTEAILSGLYEIIEREGFLIYWLNGQSPPQIDPHSVKNERTLSLIEQCAQLGIKVNFFDTTTDLGVPSCICVLIDTYDKGPKVSISGSAGLNWEDILSKSLVEALSIFHWLYKIWERENAINYYDISESNLKPFADRKIGQAERSNFWANGINFKYFQFFLEGKMQDLSVIGGQLPKLRSPGEELNYLKEKFTKMGQGYEIYYYQAKNKILDDLNYYSVKVIIPQLISLYLWEHNAQLGGCRLKDVPKKLGFEPAENFYPWPHPFP
jgi:ribosomal protein S12 methylthiotransferase accessory factor